MPVFEPPDEAVLLQAEYRLDSPAVSAGIRGFLRKTGTTRKARRSLLVCGALVAFLCARLMHEPIGWILGAVVFSLAAYVAWMQPRRFAEQTIAAWRGRAGEDSACQVTVTQSTLRQSIRTSSTAYRLSAIRTIEHDADAVFVHIDAALGIIIPSDGTFGPLGFESFAERLHEIYAEARQRAGEPRVAPAGDRP